jgi:uncharacterized protein DUF4290
MDYNTQRQKLLLPEYGRNVKKLVDYAKTITDKEERNKVARAIINIMGNLNPQFRDMTDFKHKLWDHLSIISDFELDVESPYPPPERNVLYEKPGNVPYKDQKIRWKHYGKVIEGLIQKAVEMEAGEEKNALIKIIANHMKKSYLKWNRDVVDDSHIFEDLVDLAKNQIEIPEGLKLTESREFIQQNKPSARRQPQKRKRKDNYHRSK